MSRGGLSTARFAPLLVLGALLAPLIPVAAGATGGAAVGLSMDAGSLSEAAALGAPPSYASFWVGAWTASSGWGAMDGAVTSALAAGATPVVYWYYWGDGISSSCVENGCSGKTRAQWDDMTTQLAQHLAADESAGKPV